MATNLTVRIDAKGCFTIPQYIRDRLGIEPGDTFFLEVDAERRVLHFTKADELFDILAEHALVEYRVGRTKSLFDFAIENGITLDGD